MCQVTGDGDLQVLFHLVKSEWNFTALPKSSQPAALAKFYALLQVKRKSLLEKPL